MTRASIGAAAACAALMAAAAAAPGGPATDLAGPAGETAGPAADLAVPAEEKRPVVSPFRALEERYFVEFLRRNPVTATYLGGDAWSGDLADLAEGLRDFTSVGLREEDAFNLEIVEKLRALPAGSLSPDDQVDAAVIQSQIRFVHDLTVQRRHQLRSLDTYVVEPFRGVDWQLQGMTETAPGVHGTREEWERVVRRVQKIPDYLAVARVNLKAGVQAGITPDWRMIEKDGLAATGANADYFGKELPALFEARTKGQAWAASLAPSLKKAGAAAAEAYRETRRFVAQMFYAREAAKTLGAGEMPAGGGLFRTRDLLQPRFAKDAFAFGEAVYARAVKDNLRVAKAPAALFEEVDAVVRATQDEMMAVARRVDAASGWGLSWGDREKDFASTRRVMANLMRDAPKDDAEMIAWYRAKSFGLVEYGRKHGLFDVPADYRLDVVETPEVLRSSVDGAAYYPAPPFKGTGVGRFYVSPTGNDPAHLRENNRWSMADLCAHEGFPGHDWHYQFMRSRVGSISKVRWLTPGAVEDSSSMWADSMMAEGWALYAEALMAEPRDGAPDGAYSPEERLYQLQGQLLRDVRIKVDVGIHTGRMGFDEAVEYYAANVDFLPGACSRTDDDARATCETAARAIFRYSKWPTQAITYRLGKQEILDLRAEVEAAQGARFDLKAFHERVLGAGTIPVSFVRRQILDWARAAR